MSEESSEDVELTIAEPDVVDKYKTAGNIVNQVLEELLNKVEVGASVLQLAKAADDRIWELCERAFKRDKEMAKGSAFPCCISVNEIACHYAPLEGDKLTLKEGDVVKVDVGAHIDGFIASAAHTTVCTANKAEAVTGRKADVICAAHFAAEAAHRLLRPGRTNADVTDALAKVADAFNVNVVEGVLSHSLKRYVIDGNDVIISREAPEQHVDLVTFEEYDVWCIDVAMSTGEGKLREGDPRPAVYKRDADEKYMLKGAASRSLLTVINNKYDMMPWSVRAVSADTDNKALLGIREMMEHNMILPYPVLHEKKGEFVAQFKFTVLITPKALDRITQAPLPFVSSEHKVEDIDVSIQQILKMGTNRSSKKKKNRKKKKK